MSDLELLNERQSYASHCKPSAGQRSLSVLSWIEEDPVGSKALGPVLRYSKEIWTLHTRSYPYALTWPELRAGWDLAFRRAPVSWWAAVRGPFSALKLTLDRLGWRMLDFVALESDQGV